MDNLEIGLPAEIADAIEIARQHRVVTDVRVVENNNLRVVLEIDIDAELGARSRDQSATGVLAQETAFVEFDRRFPGAAPAITLRADFNTNMPHINPHRAGEPVPPCILYGNANDLYHAWGFRRLLDQLALWIKKASRNELMNPEQGWEPARRDVVHDKLVFDLTQISALVEKKEGCTWFKCAFGQYQQDGQPPGRAFGRIQSNKVIPINTKWIPDYFPLQKVESGILGQSLALVCWPGKLPTGQPRICDTYVADTVSTLGDLYARAKMFGCARPLREQLTWLGKCTGTWEAKYSSPIFVLLCVRRPFPLTETGSEIEVLAYRLNIVFPKLIPDGDATPVYPVAHRHPITQEILRKMSGIDPTAQTPRVTMVGCGSVGSKLAIHMSRAGFIPHSLVDKNDLSPHNLARHGLLPQGTMSESLSPSSKSDALADAIEPFGKRPLVFEGDMTLCDPNGGIFKEVFPADTMMIVNSTGSHAVTDHLAGSSLPGRVIETCLLGNGAFGLMTVEGKNRNPDTLDLTAIAYEEIRSMQPGDPSLAPYSDSSDRLSVGQGCESVKSVMSDALISIYTAPIAKKLIRFLQEDLPEAGEVLLGQIGEDGLSTAWRRVVVGPTQQIEAENGGSWRIRILDRAHKKIIDDVAKHPHVETGGVIVGRASPVDRLIHIVDVIEAPPDSVRSAQAFVLGTEGLRPRIDDFEASASGALWCLGTWHSHLADQGGSPQDYKTANSLVGSGHRASMLLIRRPKGYSAIVVSGG